MVAKGGYSTMAGKSGTYRIKTAATVFDVLEVIHEEEGATLAEIHDGVDLARSTLYDYLQTLERRGYVVKDGEEFRVSLKFLDLGERAKYTQTAWREVKPALEEIGEETEENVWFVVEENGKGVYVDNYSGDRVLYTFNKIGSREHLHCIAAGKAILAQLPRERVDEIVETHGLPAFTDNTITDRDELHAELAAIRERGVAFSREERREEIRAVATPIVDGDRVLGSIALGGPTKRFTGEFFEEELPKLVTGAANRIEFSFLEDEDV